MHTFKELNPPYPHKCQIDCTNHDQVINKLEVKSKDLYYFWRNYEWLYNKYYNEPRKTDTTEYEQKIRGYKLSIEQYESTIGSYERKYKQLQRDYQSLQAQNKNLQSQNKTLENQCRTLDAQTKNLTLQINSLIKDFDRKKQLSPQIEEDYKKQIKRLKQKIQNYKDIEANLQHDLREAKLQISRIQAELQNVNDSFTGQARKYQASIRTLEESLDKLRLEIANQPNPSQFSNRSAMISQAEEVTLSYSKIRQEAEHVINMEMEKTRNELKQQFSRLVFSLTQRQLESLLVDQL